MVERLHNIPVGEILRRITIVEVASVARVAAYPGVEVAQFVSIGEAIDHHYLNSGHLADSLNAFVVLQRRDNGQGGAFIATPLHGGGARHDRREGLEALTLRIHCPALLAGARF